MEKQTLEAQNALLQKELTPENEIYYSNLLIYVRTKSLIRDNQKAEELLLEILQDILEAQRKGVSAEVYFGKNPKKIADEMIKILPIKVLDGIKLVLTGFGAYLLAVIIPTLIVPGNKLDLGNFLITGVFATIAVFLLVWLIGATLYRVKSKIGQWLFAGAGIAIFLILMAISLRVSTSFKVELSNPVGIILIALISLLLIAFYVRQEEKGTWTPFIPILVIAAIAGILIRIPLLESFFQTEKGKVYLGISLIVGLIGQYLLIYLMNKRIKQDLK